MREFLEIKPSIRVCGSRMAARCVHEVTSLMRSLVRQCAARGVFFTLHQRHGAQRVGGPGCPREHRATMPATTLSLGILVSTQIHLGIKAMFTLHTNSLEQGRRFDFCDPPTSCGPRRPVGGAALTWILHTVHRTLTLSCHSTLRDEEMETFRARWAKQRAMRLHMRILLQPQHAFQLEFFRSARVVLGFKKVGAWGVASVLTVARNSSPVLFTELSAETQQNPQFCSCPELYRRRLTEVVPQVDRSSSRGINKMIER